MGEVVVFGSLNADLVLSVKALPHAGETVLGTGLARHGGGKGANQAVAAAHIAAGLNDDERRGMRADLNQAQTAGRAGDDDDAGQGILAGQMPARAEGRGRPAELTRVRMVGRVGDDDEGRRMLADLTAAGVEVGGVLVDPAEPTGMALIMVDASGENFIGVAPGANATVTAADAARAVEGLGPGDVLVCQLEIPLDAVQAAIATAADRGAYVVCNAAPPVPQKIDGISLLVVNETEASIVLGLDDPTVETVAAASAAHGCAIVVTLGGEGAIYAGPDAGSGHVLPPTVRVVDTTGAGDTFVGACAVWLAAGASLADAVTAGVAAGAFAVTRPGARNAPNATELADLLARMASPSSPAPA